MSHSCPAATLLLRSQQSLSRAAKATSVMPTPQPLCCHQCHCCHANASATLPLPPRPLFLSLLQSLPPLCYCAATATLTPLRYCCHPAATLPPLRCQSLMAATKPSLMPCHCHSVPRAALIFIIAVAAAAALSRCHRQILPPSYRCRPAATLLLPRYCCHPSATLPPSHCHRWLPWSQCRCRAAATLSQPPPLFLLLSQPPLPSLLRCHRRMPPPHNFPRPAATLPTAAAKLPRCPPPPYSHRAATTVAASPPPLRRV